MRFLLLQESMKMKLVTMECLGHKIFCFYAIIIKCNFLHVILSIKIDKRALLNNSYPTCTFAFLLPYMIYTISYSCMISTFFSKANCGANARGIICFSYLNPLVFPIVRIPRLEQGIKTFIITFI